MANVFAQPGAMGAFRTYGPQNPGKGVRVPLMTMIWVPIEGYSNYEEDSDDSDTCISMSPTSKSQEEWAPTA